MTEDEGNDAEMLWGVTLSTVSEHARRLADTIGPGTWVLLQGDMGAGKTTLSKALCAFFGADEADVTSPTFPLLNVYEISASNAEVGAAHPSRVARVLHLDLYRMRRGTELHYVGLEDLYSPSDTLVLIEWPETLSEEEWDHFFATTRCARPTQTVLVIVERPENAIDGVGDEETRIWRMSRTSGFLPP